MKEISCGINPTNEQQVLNESNKGAKQSGCKENYKKIHEGVHPLCPNKGNDYSHSKYRAFKDMSEPIDTRFHDLSKNVYIHEEKSASQSDNSSQRAAFSNNSASYESTGFNMLKLTDLLYYNTNLMQEHQLFEYASAVKSKILEKIDKFQNPEKEELEFLCEITDGDQSEKNQRIITARTCYIVRKIIDKLPCLLNDLETPPSSQILVYQTVPNLHGITNSYCSNESPVFEIVQNSTMLLTSTTDYNLMAGIAQNDKYVISKGISNSFDIMNSNDYKENCEAQNCQTNIAKNNSSINTSLNTEDIAEESSKYCPPSANSGIRKFSFEKEKSIFYAFNLDNLLKYDVHAMHGNLVFDYGFSMKRRILEKIDQFKDPYKEKLKFLCELTDGTQRVDNQKLINERMLDLINDYKILDKHNRQNFISRNTHPSHPHYENEIVHEHRQNSDEQSRNVHTMKSHYKEERVHEHRQNFSDGQSRNVHQKKSHYEDARRR